MGLELQPRIRSWANLGGSCSYSVKSKHLHCPHHQSIIHLPCPCLKGKSNGWECQAAVDDGGVRIKGAGALRQLATLAIDKVRQNNLKTLVWDLLAMYASIYHQLLKLQGGAYDRRVHAIMQDQKDPMPSSNIPMTCCIIPMTVTIVFMAAIIVPMTCSRVFTVGGGFPMMGERCGTGNPAGGTVNASTWD